MDWGECWKALNGRVDARQTTRLTIRICQIRAATGSFQNIDRPWWEPASNADELATVPLVDYGPASEPHGVGGSVKSITFRLRQQRGHAVPFRIFTEDRDARHAVPPL
jgi:hypothetical protein